MVARWMLSAVLGMGAFFLGGQLLTFPFENHGVDVLGIKDWFNASVIGSLIGFISLPHFTEKSTIAVLSCLALSIIQYVYSLCSNSYSLQNTMALLQGVAGCTVIWLFLHSKLNRWL